MIIRSLSTFAVLVATAVYSTPAEAQIFHDFYRSVVRDFKRNNSWPEPFLASDRVAVRAPFNVMVHNGWQRQNMISDFHFDENGEKLTKTGQLKIQDILTHRIPHQRTIYVHYAGSKQATDVRIAAVQIFAQSIFPEDDTFVIRQTNIGMHGWPAERVDTINRKLLRLEEKSYQMPELPKAERYKIVD